MCYSALAVLQSDDHFKLHQIQDIDVLGMGTIPIPHRPDGFILRLPYPCHQECVSTTWMDGKQDGLSPSKTITVHPSWLYRQLDRYLRGFTGLKFYNLADQSDHCSLLSLISVIAWSLLCDSLQETKRPSNLSSRHSFLTSRSSSWSHGGCIVVAVPVKLNVWPLSPLLLGMVVLF